jgi:ribonuclease III-like protein
MSAISSRSREVRGPTLVPLTRVEMDSKPDGEPDGEQIDENELAWLNALRPFLYYNVLSHVEPDLETRKLYVTPDAMKIWRTSFTHVSFNPNNNENYEVLEKLGDEVMKVSFTWFVMQKFPDIQEGMLSLLTTYYLAKSFQAQQAKDLNLDPFIRSLIGINIHIREDSLEALFGGLFVVSDVLIPPARTISGRDVSMAYDNGNRLLEYLYRNVDINLDEIKGSEVTQIKEIFEKMRWTSGAGGNVNKEIETQYNVTDGQYMVELRFNEPFFRWVDEQNRERRRLREPPMNFSRDYPTFASAISYSIKDASNTAYKEGIQQLASYGITSEWAKEMKQENKFSESKVRGLQEFYDATKQKALNDGFASIEFQKLWKHTSYYFVQLYGDDSLGNRYIIATVDGSALLASVLKRESPIKDDDLRKAALMSYWIYGPDPTPRAYMDVMEDAKEVWTNLDDPTSLITKSTRPS